MEHLTWNKTLNTGIDEIDAQHKQIVEYLNQLNDARLHHDRAAVGEVIEGIVEYTLSHFAFEESLMAEAHYPFATAHKSVHEMFIKRVSVFKERFRNNEDIAEEFYTVLRRWLIQHIQRDDKAYARPLKAFLDLRAQEHPHPQERLGYQESWIARAIKHFFRR